MCSSLIMLDYIDSLSPHVCDFMPNEDGNDSLTKVPLGEGATYFYCEVSGVLEKHFKRHKCNPIPNKFIPSILYDPDVVLSPDGLHYERLITDEGESVEKCMFVFTDEQTINDITCSFLDQIGFRKIVNSEIKTGSKLHDYPHNILWALQIISFINEWHEEGNLNELFWEMSEVLKKAISILIAYTNKDSNINYTIETGNYLLKEMPIVTLHTSCLVR